MSHGPDRNAPHTAPKRGGFLRGLLKAGEFVLAAVVVAGVATVGALYGYHFAGKTHLATGVTPGGDQQAASAVSVDVTALYTSTPELVAKGKALYAINCSACHGVSGHGDGAAATALNPRPRNFTAAEGWKFGSGTARVVKTISEGSPGTAMAAFSGMPLPDRMALAHYIRSLQPAPAEDKEEDKKWLGIGRPGGAAAAAAAPAGPSIPVALAMARMAEAAPDTGVVLTPPAADGPGAGIYNARCAACHGLTGEGAVRVKMLGSSPYAYVRTKSLAAGSGAWARDFAAFERMVLEGFPGTTKVSNGDLSRDAVRELHLYTLMLRARQETAARAGS
jgi:mono/diheme cytochrome c family protein